MHDLDHAQWRKSSRRPDQVRPPRPAPPCANKPRLSYATCPTSCPAATPVPATTGTPHVPFPHLTAHHVARRVRLLTAPSTLNPLIDTFQGRCDMYYLKRYGLPALYWNLALRGLA